MGFNAKAQGHDIKSLPVITGRLLISGVSRPCRWQGCPG